MSTNPQKDYQNNQPGGVDPDRPNQAPGTPPDKELPGHRQPEPGQPPNPDRNNPDGEPPQREPGQKPQVGA